MCNRARLSSEPETLFEKFGAGWAAGVVRPNSDPQELFPSSKAYVIRNEDGRRVLDLMNWDVLGGAARYELTNVRDLEDRWRTLASDPTKRCLVPLTEFCEWMPKPMEPPTGGKPIKGEMWFDVIDQPVFAVGGFWQVTAKGRSFAMVTCDPNELVRPIHPKAMITILQPADHDRWLRGGFSDVLALQQPYPADRMTMRGPVFPTRAKG